MFNFGKLTGRFLISKVSAAIAVSLLLTSYCCNFNKNNEAYPFYIEITGPFSIGDALNSGKVVYKSGIHIFDENEPDIYFFKIKNNAPDTLSVTIDASTGFMLTNCRYYEMNDNGSYRLASGFPIVDNGPAIADTIMPYQEKIYYAPLHLINDGVVELYCRINSKFLDSLNVNTGLLPGFFLQVQHPYFLYEVRGGRIHEIANKNAFFRKVLVN